MLGALSLKVFPIHTIEDIMKDEKRYNGRANWATWNILLQVFNEKGIHLQMVANRPYTAQSAEEFVSEMFPEGTPGKTGKVIPEEMENVIWEDVAEAFNEE